MPYGVSLKLYRNMGGCILEINPVISFVYDFVDPDPEFASGVENMGSSS